MAGCVSAGNTRFGTVPMMELSINGVALGYTEAQVSSLLGVPDRTHSPVADPGDNGPTTEWEFANLSVGLRRGKVVALSCFRQTCTTSAGLAVGDSVRAIQVTYGSTITIYTDNSLGSSLYRVPGSRSCGLRIEHDLGIVHAIRASCSMEF